VHRLKSKYRREPSASQASSLTWQTLVHELRSRILAGKFGVEGRLPTIDELEIGKEGLKAARHASRIAFRVLIEQGLIETRGRAGTFVRTVKENQRPRLIGWICDSLSFQFGAGVGEGIIRFLDDQNRESQADSGSPHPPRYRMVTALCNNARDESRLLREMVQEVNGLIIFPAHGEPREPVELDAFREYARKEIPLVQVGRWIAADDLSTPVVLYAEDSVGEKLATFVLEHLAQWNVRTQESVPIFILTERGNRDHMQRADAFARVMAGHFKERWRDEINEHATRYVRERVGTELTNRLLRNNAIPVGRSTAVIACTSDRIAIGVLDTLRKHEIRVPEDVVVIGVDNEPFGAFSRPSLTSLELDARALGARAAKTVLQMIDGGVPPSQWIVLSTAVKSIAARESAPASETMPTGSVFEAST